jgi:transcriptional regulator with XRE-family HTH domain
MEGEMKRDRPSRIKTRVFDIAARQGMTLTALAEAMDLSVAAVSRVRKGSLNGGAGSRGVSSVFIAGAQRAFPTFAYGELFYIEEEKAS